MTSPQAEGEASCRIMNISEF